MGRDIFTAMNSPDLFWAVFAAVLSAIILGGTFFWALIAFSRRERGGTENSVAGNTIFMAVMLPLGFLAMGLYIALQ
jgi:hypothetical protein